MQTLERVLRHLRCSVVSSLALLILPAAMAADERPNFIFIITDDQRWDALGEDGTLIGACAPVREMRERYAVE